MPKYGCLKDCEFLHAPFKEGEEIVFPDEINPPSTRFIEIPFEPLRVGPIATFPDPTPRFRLADLNGGRTVWAKGGSYGRDGLEGRIVHVEALTGVELKPGQDARWFLEQYNRFMYEAQKIPGAATFGKYLRKLGFGARIEVEDEAPGPSDHGDGSESNTPGLSPSVAVGRPMEDTSQAAPSNLFALRGQIFTIRYRDGDEIQMSSSKGLRQIAYLLARPGKEVPALSLVGIDEKRESGTREREYIGEAKQEVLDDTTVRKLKERRDDYKDRIDRAEQAGETNLAAELKEEAEAVDEELVRQLRPSGQSRAFTTPQKQAHDAVRKTIRRALRGLKPHDAELYQHLDGTLQLGQDCHYAPSKTMSWKTE